jgi:phage gp36-like protein
MATYASSTEFQNAIGGSAALTWISDLVNSATDSNAVTSALDWGTSVIDTYVAGTAGTTGTAGAMWSTEPTQAVQCNIDLALYILYLRIRRDVPPEIVALYQGRIAELEKVQDGTLSWVTSEDPPSVNTGRVYYFGSGSTARTDNPRRTRRDQLDLL